MEATSASKKTEDRQHVLVQAVGACLVLLMAVAGFMVAAQEKAAAAVHAVYQTTVGVSARSTPTAAPTGVYGIPAGASFGVECQTIGEPVGQYGNTLYFWTVYGGRGMYVPDTFTNSPHLAGQPPIAGIPMCGGTPAPPPVGTGIWVGSPLAGTWGYGPDPSSIPLNGHHRFAKASPTNDWSVDISSTGPNRDAYLYVAPSNSAYNGRVTTVVSQVIDDNACANGGGGDLVTVQVRFDGATVGQVSYGHLDRNPNLRVGQTVGRWGTWLGRTAYLSGGATGGSRCWTGPHLHTELRASTNYACWNRGFGLGQAVGATNFIGFVSGPSTTPSYSRPCA